MQDIARTTAVNESEMQHAHTISGRVLSDVGSLPSISALCSLEVACRE